MADLELHIDALLLGKAVPFRGEERSAFAKSPVAGRVRVTRHGLAGDEQADRVHHGGPDKAIHLYPHEHYAAWDAFLGGHELLAHPGAFGENITSRGGDEASICIGDRLSLGSAVVEVSHGRMPCWKIDHRFARKGVTAEVVRSGRCGLYFRVIAEGEAQAGDDMRLIERTYPDWPVARIFALLVAGGYKRDMASVREAADLAPLADVWRGWARQLLD